MLEMSGFVERQGTEICDNIGVMPAMNLNSRGLRNKFGRTVGDYFKITTINMEPSDVVRKLGWLGCVRLKKQAKIHQAPVFWR